MPMCMRVDNSSDTQSQEDAPTKAADMLPLHLLVQEGRSAATKGLLHDFSNVMVGLCSLSENALEDTEPGTPLHDDMEIIRDSAVRAQLLIRRIMSLNSGDEGERSLVEPCSWLNNELETLRATLPKGSELLVGSSTRGMLLHVNESLLRDFLLLVAARVASRHKERLRLTLDAEEKDGECLLIISFEGTSAQKKVNNEQVLRDAIAHELARKMGGRCEIVGNGDSGLILKLHLPKA